MPSLIDRLLVISGGQSGVDTVGLEVAREHGIRTGGTAPHGWWRYSDDGALTRAPDLLRSFGLVEGPPDPKRWPIRTGLNVRDSDLTVWFGTQSPGFFCTRKACLAYEKPFLVNHPADSIASQIQVLFREGTTIRRGMNGPIEEIEAPFIWVNVAGNRYHTNPEASETARTTLTEAFRQLRALSIREALDLDDEPW